LGLFPIYGKSKNSCSKPATKWESLPGRLGICYSTVGSFGMESMEVCWILIIPVAIMVFVVIQTPKWARLWMTGQLGQLKAINLIHS
jgi:hypothetical protein